MVSAAPPAVRPRLRSLVTRPGSTPMTKSISVVGRGRAEAEAQRVARARVRQAHRAQHVRRLERSGRAGRSGRDGDALEIERDQQRLGLDAVEADVASCSGTRRSRIAVDGGARHDGEDAALEPIAQRGRLSRPTRPSCARASAAATPSPAIAGTFSVPARRLRSCRPPVMCGISRTPRRIHSAPMPFGPPNLCAGERRADRRRASGPTPESCRPTARRRCERRAPCARAIAASSAIGWIVPTSLLACITETSAVSRRHRLRRARRATACRARRPAATVTRPAAPLERLDGVEHGLVLDARRDEVPAAGRLERLGGAANREVVGLGAAGREHDLARHRRRSARPPRRARRRRPPWPAGRMRGPTTALPKSSREHARRSRRRPRAAGGVVAL